MIEIRRQHLRKGNLVGVSLMDLSKGLPLLLFNQLLLAKLEAYVFSANSLNL